MPPYGAKALIPVRGGVDLARLDLRAAAEPGVTVVTSPSALLMTEGLTTVLTDAGRRPLWLRLGREDQDPAMLLTSLIVAARRHDPAAGRATLDLMRARPGPVYGWADLFDRFADELLGLVRDDGALVLEHAHRLPAAGTGLALLGRRVFPRLTRAGMSCILLTYQDLASPALALATVRRIGREFRPPAPIVRAALRAAREVLGPEADREWPAEIKIDDLLAGVARGLLATAGADERRRLGLAVELEYADRAGTPAAGRGGLPEGPWWQELDDGWARIRTAWRGPLRAVLSRRDLPGRGELSRTAARLAADGNLDRAVPLYLDLRDEAGAARVLSANAERLMDLGQWETLDGWIHRLPDGVQAGHPQLIHYRGEIAAAHGEATDAQRWFSLAASRFTARADHRGACRAMLAASTLAASTGDIRTAAAQAAAAGALAEATGDPTDRMWASWQQASVTLAGDPEAPWCRSPARPRTGPRRTPYASPRGSAGNCCGCAGVASGIGKRRPLSRNESARRSAGSSPRSRRPRRSRCHRTAGGRPPRCRSACGPSASRLRVASRPCHPRRRPPSPPPVPKAPRRSRAAPFS